MILFTNRPLSSKNSWASSNTSSSLSYACNNWRHEFRSYFSFRLFCLEMNFLNFWFFVFTALLGRIRPSIAISATNREWMTYKKTESKQRSAFYLHTTQGASTGCAGNAMRPVDALAGTVTVSLTFSIACSLSTNEKNMIVLRHTANRRCASLNVLAVVDDVVASIPNC